MKGENLGLSLLTSLFMITGAVLIYLGSIYNIDYFTRFGIRVIVSWWALWGGLFILLPLVLKLWKHLKIIIKDIL